VSRVIHRERRAGVAGAIAVLRSEPRARVAARATEADAAALSRRFLRPETAPGAIRPVRFYPNLGLLFGSVDRDGLAALRCDARVLSVSRPPSLGGPIRPPRAGAARLTRKLTWGIEALGIPALWKEGLTGRGVLVGHLDTGVDARHPALRDGAVARFAEFDLLGRLVRPTPRPHDTQGHGTHTAATIAGRPVRGRRLGVAPGASLASAIVIEGGDVVARVLRGMDWALGQGVRVLSLSFGFRGRWEKLRTLTRICRERGVLPVFAVGNEGPGTSCSPGNCGEALSVGACDRARRVPYFSSSERLHRRRDGLVPDLIAPGVDVISARPGRGYQSMDGTSVAAPHVAGLAALLLEAAPDCTVARLERAILDSCTRPRTMSRQRANRGLPRARRALEVLEGKV
jgi:subtilisin family serine protease